MILAWSVLFDSNTWMCVLFIVLLWQRDGKGWSTLLLTMIVQLSTLWFYFRERVIIQIELVIRSLL